MPLTLTPLHPLLAARAEGLDLTRPLTPGEASEIHAAMDNYAVLVIPGQDIDDDQHMAFGQALGTIEATRGVVDVHRHRLKHDSMNDISNIDTDGNLLAADDRRRMFNLGNRLWHSDSSFKATPAKYSMLHARIIPPDGGETEFADMRAAWDALPAKMQARLKPLITQHSLIYSRGNLGFTDYTDEERVKFAPVPQRLVRRHANGRVSLYLSSHAGTIDGMPIPEARALLRDLIEHATQREFVYRHSWTQHELVMWDNRTTMHRARPFDDQAHARDMRRVTIEDDAPTLAQQAA
ncbi:MAG: 2,4-dichlorophenoxyacetate monooxygenase [Rhodospirillales bacterium]|jgi:alpha-ketoglutarate-dependent 2,4-dichlorophenoxyacetate dioxygenase|nr:2,4-dichlorophenoxyacetate monooxygenase [Rhodospirillales bacterium]